MDPDALWLRVRLKHRTKVTSGVGTGFAGLMLAPTLGASTLGLWANGRTLDIARRKAKIIKEELQRRNLPPYKGRKRDTMVPLGISIVALATVGIIDVCCLGFTSSVLVSAVAPHGMSALSALFHHPGEFLTATWHGIEFQGQQTFHLDGHRLAISVPDYHTSIVHAIHQSVPNSTPGPELYTAAHDAMRTLKSQVAANVHACLAAGGDPHAVHTVAADNFIREVASHCNSSTAMAGLNTGMEIAQTAEQQAAHLIIGKNFLQNIRPSIKVDDPTYETWREREGTSGPFELPKTLTTEKVVRESSAQVLTGKTPRVFIFLSKAGQPISQQIIAEQSPDTCIHGHNEATHRICFFCKFSIEPEAQPYYHCCECSDITISATGGVDICEVCIAGRGCSCSNRAEHILYRKGLLTSTVDYGNLTPAKGKKVKKTEKRQNEKNHIDSKVEDPVAPKKEKLWNRTWKRRKESILGFSQQQADDSDELQALVESEKQLAEYDIETDEEACSVEGDRQSVYIAAAE